MTTNTRKSIGLQSIYAEMDRVKYSCQHELALYIAEYLESSARQFGVDTREFLVGKRLDSILDTGSNLGSIERPRSQWHDEIVRLAETLFLSSDSLGPMVEGYLSLDDVSMVRCAIGTGERRIETYIFMSS